MKKLTSFMTLTILLVSFSVNAAELQPVKDKLSAFSQSSFAETWFDVLVEKRQHARNSVHLPDFGTGTYTISAWIKTTGGGSIMSKTSPTGKWVPGGKALFVRGGRVGFDIGWVGAVKLTASEMTLLY
jgi:hypothetical protein